MAACSLLCPLLLRIPYFITLDVTKQQFCKIPSPGKSVRSGNRRSKSAAFVCGPQILLLVTFTHSLSHSEGQHSSIRLRSSKLQKVSEFRRLPRELQYSCESHEDFVMSGLPRDVGEEWV